jgi:aromatic-L-amino-acid decarboxylase
MMDWLAELCGLPAAFRCNGGAGPGGGVIQVGRGSWATAD